MEEAKSFSLRGEQAPPGQVITFYSYKGGTGRTMAMANIACLLARRQGEGRGVLMVDWDLEAPGLHRFFEGKFTNQFADARLPDQAFDEYPGLIELFQELGKRVRSATSPGDAQDEDGANEIISSIGLKRFVLQTDIPSLFLMKAGSFNENYSKRVNTFQWEELFNRSPWLIRLLVEHLAGLFQYVLVDSRTGLTDTSGICTKLIPEKLVVVFTPNRQSLTGVTQLVRKATSYRRNSDELRP